MKTSFKIISMFFALIIFNSCDEATKSDLMLDNEIVTVSYGTSFGECIGYCQHQITIQSDKIQYLAKAINAESNLPDISYSTQITTEQWNELTDKIDFVIFRNLDEVNGCPDCADGGAEWIEIKTNNSTHKVTFEYQNEPEGVKGFIDDLREYMSNIEESENVKL